MKTKRKGLLGIILILVVVILAGITYKMIFNESISEITTAITAVAGVIAIIYQLKKEHDISRAEFIFNMNNSFSENEDIDTIYKKLKRFRDSEDEEFTKEEGRLMGDYIMYFEIMSYLIDEDIIGIKMVDELFSGRFFLFVNNPDVQKYQLQYSGVMPKIFELYCLWYNYRKKHGFPFLYNENQLHEELNHYFNVDEKGYLSTNEKNIKASVPRIQRPNNARA